MPELVLYREVARGHYGFAVFPLELGDIAQDPAARECVRWLERRFKRSLRAIRQFMELAEAEPTQT